MCKEDMDPNGILHTKDNNPNDIRGFAQEMHNPILGLFLIMG